MMTDRGLIAKIDACAALIRSDKVYEAINGAEKARDLVERYGVDPRDLSPSARRALEPFACVTWLRVRGCWARWAAEVGEDAALWHVTGAGAVDAATMIAFAERRGYRRRFGNDTQ